MGLKSGNKRIVKRRVPRVELLKVDKTDSLDVEQTIKIFSHIAKQEGMRERTISDYAKFYRYFTKEVEVTDLKKMNADHIGLYIDSLLEKGLSPVTVNIRLSGLKSLFRRLEKHEYIKENPAINFSKLRTDESKIYTFNNSQIKRLFRVVDTTSYAGFRDYVAMLLMLHCGMRVNEVAALEINDIDFDNGVILLAGAKNKNRRSRSIPMSKRIIGEIKQLITESMEYFEEVKHVFLTQDGRRLDNDIIRKRMYTYGRLSGLYRECRVSPHSLRHTFACNYLRDGGSVNALMHILGHKDIASTMRYVRMTSEEVKEQYETVLSKRNYEV